jgi:adenylate cyclase
MASPTQPLRFVRPVEKRRRISVALILALSFGTLVFLSVGGVLALSVSANYRNTFDLLGTQSNLLVDAMEDSLRAHMSRAESAVDGIADLYANGGFEIDDDDRMTSTLSGALAVVPEADAILIYTVDLKQRGVVRDAEGQGAETLIKPLPLSDETSPNVRAALEARRKVDGRRWGSFVANEFGLFAYVSVPLVRDGEVRGWVVAPVELQTLSRIARDLSRRFGTHAFILDGEDRILADDRLSAPEAKQAGIEALMPLSKYGDDVLANYASRRVLSEFGAARTRNVEVAEIEPANAKESDIPFWGETRSDIVITRTISGYGERPWVLGAYYEQSQVGDELMRAWLSAVLGLIGMLCAVAAAILLGKRLSRPVQAIAGHAQRVADFDLDGMEPLPRSRVLELDNQAVAFNSMLVGLRAFSTYIPRSLVAKLVRSGEIGIAEPREAIVTVMFTDIAGFTALSEQMSAAESAKLLNHHFAALCHAVDAQGGTVDKFLGDGMLAFFGAPDQLKGHAAAAVRAALAIRDEIEADNRRATAEGRPALRVRIGIHTGPVIVGNIGASDRVNYTIVGDTVNVSQRLQELGKVLAPKATVTIAVSSETASRLDERFATASAGSHSLRGRGEAVEVFLVESVAERATERDRELGAA